MGVNRYAGVNWSTTTITKEHFQIFGEMVQKVLKMRKCNLFFYQICLHVG